MYTADREIWAKAFNTELVVTVDKATRTGEGREVFVPAVAACDRAQS